MYDASAKLPSGLLNGNINQFGDFDQCLNVNSQQNGVIGKYCLAYIQISIPKKFKRIDRIRKLIQSHDAFVSDFDDVSILEFNFVCSAITFEINKNAIHYIRALQ